MKKEDWREKIEDWRLKIEERRLKKEDGWIGNDELGMRNKDFKKVWIEKSYPQKNPLSWVLSHLSERLFLWIATVLSEPRDDVYILWTLS